MDKMTMNVLGELPVTADAISGMTPVVNQQITSLYDFSQFNKIVHIGSGDGGLIISILQANPRAFGVILDAQEAISEARARIEAAGLADRCATIAGDLFKFVPAGGDLYIINWIIHDQDNERVLRLLRNIRNQIPPQGRVLIVDCFVPEGDETANEFDQLLAAAGFRFLRVIPTDTPTSMVEAEPA
jgi:cyclopropane fatty-acyl-phospholipid synthase-like methyltransferase